MFQLFQLREMRAKTKEVISLLEKQAFSDYIRRGVHRHDLHQWREIALMHHSLLEEYEDLVLCFNENHDPDNGRFTSGPGGGGGNNQQPPSQQPAASRRPASERNAGSDEWRSGTSGLDKSKAIEKIHAIVKPKPPKPGEGECAKYVRIALDAGGVKIAFPYPRSAKDYAAVLSGYGFHKLSPKPQPDYDPKQGDIVVIQNHQNVSKDGHIALFDGHTWVSDFKQRPNDIWPGQRYRNTKPDYDVFRP